MSAEHGDNHEECRHLLKKKTAEFSKTEALLLQRLELLQIKLDDHVKKEEQLKQMHETMMSALQNNIFSDDGSNSIEIITKLHEEEKVKIIENHKLDLKYFENENFELKQEIDELKALNYELEEKGTCNCDEVRELNNQLELKIQSLQEHISSLEQTQSKIIADKSNEINELIDKSNTERENEIHKIKESCRTQLFEIQEEYAEKIRINQEKIDKLTNENSQIKKELAKNKNLEEIKALHQKLEKLRNASFEELISIK